MSNSVGSARRSALTLLQSGLQFGNLVAVASLLVSSTSNEVAEKIDRDHPVEGNVGQLVSIAGGPVVQDVGGGLFR